MMLIDSRSFRCLMSSPRYKNIELGRNEDSVIAGFDPAHLLVEELRVCRTQPHPIALTLLLFAENPRTAG